MVYAWGSGKYGQLGCGDEINWTRFPHVVRLPEKVAIQQIAVGFHHVVALAGARERRRLVAHAVAP